MVGSPYNAPIYAFMHHGRIIVHKVYVHDTRSVK